MKLNEVGFENAKRLIKEGKVDVKSPWEMTTADENKILGDGNWDEYAKWFLAVDESANEETKAKYKFPFGKNGKVYRSGLIAIRQRAGQFGYDKIFESAGELLQMIDEQMNEFEEEKWFPIFWNGRHKNKGVKNEWTPEDVERIYEKNKTREIPLIVRHSKDELPIVGFAKGLRKRVENGKVILDAKLAKISKWFFDILKNANMDKVSIALDSDLSTIRHIGFVENPAVEGLPAVTFENEYMFDKKEIEMEFEEKMKELAKENEELKERLQKLEAERLEFQIQNKIDALTSSLPPVIKERVEKIIRGLAKSIEFENDATFVEFEALIRELPKIYFEQNVVQTKPQNDIEVLDKKIEMYKKRRV